MVKIRMIHPLWKVASIMTLVTTRSPQALQPVQPEPTVDDSTDRWVDATWEEFVTISDDPKSEKASCYYYNHQMRIETMGVGPSHALENTLVTLAIGLFCMVKGIRIGGLTNASYQKKDTREAQPDLSYYFDEQVALIPSGNTIIDLDAAMPPRLTIEIAATSLNADLGLKRLLYEELGVQEYWVVDVERTEIFAFQILENGGSRRITDSVVLPGLAIVTIETALRDRKTSDDSQIMANLMKEFAT